MSETVEAPVQISAEQQQNIVNPFSTKAWAETQPEIKETIELPKTEVPIAEVIPTPQIEEKLDPNVYLKNKWGWDSEEIADNEIKTLREKAAKGFEYKNDESRKIAEYINEDKIDDLYQFLDIQKKIGRLATADVSDKKMATELVKFGIKKDNPTLLDDEVDFLFEEKYSTPDKPIKGELEEDSEYEEKLAVWKTQVSNVEKRLVIEAKMNQPKMAQLKTELVLPQISKSQETVNQPNPEVAKKVRETFLNKLESDFSKTDGFSTQVKDESVEIPVSFKIPDEDKIAIKGRLQKEFDVEDFIMSRWFSDKGEPQIERIISDIYLLENPDKVFSGIANNSANQRLIEFRKQANNVHLNQQTNQNTFQPNADGKSNVSPFKKEAWSEKPPALIS